MSSKTKRVAAVLTAVVAVSLLAASTSGAANFTASNYPTTLQGGALKGSGKFTSEAGSVECAAESSATLNGQSSTLSTTNTKVTSCSAFGFLTAEIKGEGCYGVVHLASGSGDSYSGLGDLVCPAGAAVVMTMGTCEVKTFPQTGLGSIQFTNETAAKRIAVKANVTGIAYTVTKDGIGCPYGGTGAKTGATLSQSTASQLITNNGADSDIG